MHDEQMELLLEYLYWIGYSLDFLAAAQFQYLDPESPCSLLYEEPDMPPHPSPIEYREAIRPEARQANPTRWYPV